MKHVLSVEVECDRDEAGQLLDRLVDVAAGVGPIHYFSVEDAAVDSRLGVEWGGR